MAPLQPPSLLVSACVEAGEKEKGIYQRECLSQLEQD